MDKTAWHFTGPTLRDGRPIPAIGEWLEHEGPVEICRSGLHASYHPFDAVWYGRSPKFLHLVEVKDVVARERDKFVCRRRRILETRVIAGFLRRFACDQALAVLPLGTPPVIEKYLRYPSFYARSYSEAQAWQEWQDLCSLCLVECETEEESRYQAVRYACHEDVCYAVVRSAYYAMETGVLPYDARQKFADDVFRMFGL